jgi:hypothetical protein
VFQTKEAKSGRAVALRERTEMHLEFWWEKLKKVDNFEDPDTDGSPTVLDVEWWSSRFRIMTSA